MVCLRPLICIILQLPVLFYVKTRVFGKENIWEVCLYNCLALETWKILMKMVFETPKDIKDLNNSSYLC